MVCSDFRWRRWTTVVLATVLLAAVGPSRAADGSLEREQAALDAKIQQLISQLGDVEFATRERAQSELERLGLAAFDALYEAQHADDIEIAMRARYLVRSLRVNWSRDDDPAEVKRILRSYGSHSETERRSRMLRLASLPDGEGTAALCRLARFEASDVLSKQAALLAIGQDVPDERDAGQETVTRINATVGLSKRSAAQWLRVYAQSLADAEGSLAAWDKLTTAEQELFNKRPHETSREVVRDLLRWQVDLLNRLDHEEQALAVVERSLELVIDTRQDILEVVDWLMDREAWAGMDAVGKKFSKHFEDDAVLLYRLAEAQLNQGHMGEAEATAQRAQKKLPDQPDAHIVAAYSLQERGMTNWAEREYRYVMKQGPAGSIHDLRARMLLSEMLHDLESELAAAEVLQGAADLIDKNPSVADTLRSRLGRDPGALLSRMHFFYALHNAKDGEPKKKLDQLEQAIKQDPTDADVLIAMFRVKDPDEAWREKTMHHIDTATGHFRDQIEAFTGQMANAPSEPLREYAKRQLASANNQFAWLVSNTTGDFDEAVRCSHKSLELRPDTAGYLDTLGRCYYAKGDLENAVRYQRRAVELDPHSLQIRRQLELFETAQKEAEQNGDPDQAESGE